MAKRGGGRWVENPEDIGEISDPNFVRLPDPALLFATRAERLRELANGHMLEDYLRFVAALASAQHETAASLPSPPAADPATLDMRLAASMPPLAPDLLEGESDVFEAILARVLDTVDLSAAPEQARDARTLLQHTPDTGRLALAEGMLMGSYPADRLAEGLFVASALQVFLAGHAAALPATRLRPVGDGVCPACGSAPVASMVVSWPGANRVRYCCCSLCETMWNYVRIKCTSCGSTEKIAYYKAENLPETIAVETCGVCRCYIKHLHKHLDSKIEPVADDIASFWLDIKIREDGFRPSGLNPLFISG